jgi:beta-N-acetylhexosaminidase
MAAVLPVRAACGQIIVGGFDGPLLPEAFRGALERGERGGVILFRRNLGRSLDDVTALNRSVLRACPPELPPLIGVDQEGGRVARLSAPVLELPPMRAFGARGDADLVFRAASALGEELLSLGFNMSFAPVLDVDTCPDNPVIGDRSFSSDPSVVAILGIAYARGLHVAGVMACGKHFPGHGDTTIDSHLDLPRVEHPRTRLDAIELAPFRGARAETFAAFMTAHVVYDALDAEQPATLSRRIATDLLREELGFDGVLVSDDLEMKAIADQMPIEESAVRAVRAGCDVLLVCSSMALQVRAHEALVREAERDPGFHERVQEAAARGIAARRERPPRPLDENSVARVVGGPASDAIARELKSLGLVS